MTSINQNISDEYSKLANDSKGFIFFYNEDDDLKHIRYCSDLARGVSLLKQLSQRPYVGQTNERVYPKAYELSPYTGMPYRRGDYDCYDSDKKQYFYFKPKKLKRIEAHACDDLLENHCWRKIKYLCSRFELPPTQAYNKWIEENNKSEEQRLKEEIEGLRDENYDLHLEIKRLKSVIALAHVDCEGRVWNNVRYGSKLCQSDIF